MRNDKSNKPEVDEAILAELLAEPDVAALVEAMTPEERDWYKELLITEGIYARYVKERPKDKG